MADEGKNQSLDDVVKPEVDAATAEPTLPDKYKGKSVEDIVKMHQEAEKLIGRQAGELGDLRKWADTLIQTSVKEPTKQEEEEPDFFVNPKAAVKHTLETDPTIKATLERTRALEARLNQEALEKAHPDYTDLIADSGFQEWVGSSKYRTQLFKTANDNWDFDAANELFSTYKALNKKAEATDSKAAVKRASVPSGGQATDVEDGATRKMYRRADIIKLMQTDPKRYQALQADIMKAYQEGRVR